LPLSCQCGAIAFAPIVFDRTAGGLT
jgi:hypothetical protein